MAGSFTSMDILIDIRESDDDCREGLGGDIYSHEST